MLTQVGCMRLAGDISMTSSPIWECTIVFFLQVPAVTIYFYSFMFFMFNFFFGFFLPCFLARVKTGLVHSYLSTYIFWRREMQGMQWWSSLLYHFLFTCLVYYYYGDIGCSHGSGFPPVDGNKRGTIAYFRGSLYTTRQFGLGSFPNSPILWARPTGPNGRSRFEPLYLPSMCLVCLAGYWHWGTYNLARIVNSKATSDPTI